MRFHRIARLRARNKLPRKAAGKSRCRAKNVGALFLSAADDMLSTCRIMTWRHIDHVLHIFSTLARGLIVSGCAVSDASQEVSGLAVGRISHFGQSWSYFR